MVYSFHWYWQSYIIWKLYVYLIRTVFLRFFYLRVMALSVWKLSYFPDYFPLMSPSTSISNILRYILLISVIWIVLSKCPRHRPYRIFMRFPEIYRAHYKFPGSDDEGCLLNIFILRNHSMPFERPYPVFNCIFDIRALSLFKVLELFPAFLHFILPFVWNGIRYNHFLYFSFNRFLSPVGYIVVLFYKVSNISFHTTNIYTVYGRRYKIFAFNSRNLSSRLLNTKFLRSRESECVHSID